jgi:hypothetical protein
VADECGAKNTSKRLSAANLETLRKKTWRLPRNCKQERGALSSSIK